MRKVNVHDDQFSFKIRVQKGDKLSGEVEYVQFDSVQHNMPGV